MAAARAVYAACSSEAQLVERSVGNDLAVRLLGCSVGDGVTELVVSVRRQQELHKIMWTRFIRQPPSLASLLSFRIGRSACEAPRALMHVVHVRCAGSHGSSALLPVSVRLDALNASSRHLEKRDAAAAGWRVPLVRRPSLGRVMVCSGAAVHGSLEVRRGMSQKRAAVQASRRGQWGATEFAQAKPRRSVTCSPRRALPGCRCACTSRSCLHEMREAARRLSSCQAWCAKCGPSGRWS